MSRLSTPFTFTSNGAVNFAGGATISLPNNTVNDADVQTPSAGQGINATKVNHAVEIAYRQNATGDKAATAAADAGSNVYSARNAGTIVGVRAFSAAAATGGDSVTVDVRKAANGSTSYTTILSSVITLNSGVAANTDTAGTLNVFTYAAGDKFEVIVTASGTSVKGLGVVLDLFENGT